MTAPNDPKEAKRLLAEAGYPKGFKTPLTATSGLGRDLVDAVQLVQGYLKAVGIEAELKLQEYGAYVATTAQGKYEGMIYGPKHYVYANSVTVTATWRPYVKNYGPNQTFDYGSRVAALWLDR